MNKENIITPVIILGLSIAFIIISVLFIFFSNNPKLLKYKLKTGAVIISLTTFVNLHGFSQKTCYKPAISREIIRLDKQDESQYIKIYKDEKKITGVMENVLSEDYYFTVTDSSDKLIKKGILVAINGKFDENKENFEINTGQLKTGKYSIKVCSGKDNFEKGISIYSGTLYVSDKKEPAVMCYYY